MGNTTNDENVRFKTILDFVNCKTRELEFDIVNMIRDNINNIDDSCKLALKEKITQLEYIEKYLDEDYIYDFIDDYYEE